MKKSRDFGQPENKANCRPSAGKTKQGGWGEIPQFGGFLQVKVALMLIRYLLYEDNYEYGQDEGGRTCRACRIAHVERKIEPAGLFPVLRGTYCKTINAANSRRLLLYYCRESYESFLCRQVRLDRSDEADLLADETAQIHLRSCTGR